MGDSGYTDLGFLAKLDNAETNAEAQKSEPDLKRAQGNLIGVWSRREILVSKSAFGDFFLNREGNKVIYYLGIKEYS